jgi:hypothetical protein
VRRARGEHGRTGTIGAAQIFEGPGMSGQSLTELKTQTEVEKMIAEIEKLRAETRKIVRETGVIPFVAGAAFMAAATGLATIVFKYVMGTP